MTFFKELNKNHWAQEFFESQGLNESLIAILVFAIDLIILIGIAWLADFLARKIILALIHRWVKKTKATWDDYFYDQKVFISLSHLFPALILKLGLPIIFNEFPKVVSAINFVLAVYIIILVIKVTNKVLKALEAVIESSEKSKDKPYGTLLQVLRILSYFVGGIFIISLSFDIEPGAILGAFAGTTAILILIFQDAINGLLANFQISMYDLLKKGDWVTFEKYGVDGTVSSIDLTTIKIRNFDNTISSVPAKAFTSDSFVNWRGMQETNVRRIKRNILIDINSIQYLSEEDIKSIENIALVNEYLKDKEAKINSFNQEKKIDTSLKINGRQQTNIGVFRAYIVSYLINHPMVHNDHTLMVRQLQPTEYGIPLEVYCFASTTVWTEYENVQADIFDHLYAASSFFNLELYQRPSGKDFNGKRLNA